VIPETRQNTRGEQDQQLGHHLSMQAAADHLQRHHTPQKTEPRDSRGSKKFRTEFHREDTVH
jgi:hypothetical protein